MNLSSVVQKIKDFGGPNWLYVGGLLSVVGTFVVDIWLTINYELDANVSLIYLSILVSAFTILYGVRSNWSSSKVGRVFFVKSIFLSLVIIQISVANWWPGDYPLKHQIRFILYTSGAWTYASMVLTLITEQRKDREHRRQLEEEIIALRRARSEDLQ